MKRLTIAVIFLVGCSIQSSTSKRDQATFIAFVQTHAQDPKNLEVISFGEPRDWEDGYLRQFKIRCDAVDFTPEKAKVSLEEGAVYFKKDGTIKRADLNRCQRSWLP